MRKFRDRSNPKISSSISYSKCSECGKMLSPNEIYDSRYCKDCAEIFKTAKKLSYQRCVHCHNFFPKTKLVVLGKLNLSYCNDCASKAVHCKYCGEKFIPDSPSEMVCSLCFDSKSRNCIKCGHDFVPEKSHFNICPDCYGLNKKNKDEFDNNNTNELNSESEIEFKDIDNLIESFMDKNARSEAIKTLSEMGEEVIGPLIEMLGENHTIRKYAIQTLILIGQPALIPLIEGLDYINDDQRRGCVKTLGKIGDSSAIEPLINVLHDDYDPKIRLAAANALALINDDSTLKPLIKSLKEDNNPKVRTSCALAIGNIANDGEIESLIEALNDESKSVIKASMVSIIKIKGENFLQDILNSKNREEGKISSYSEKVFDIKSFIEKIQNDDLKTKIESSICLIDSSVDDFVNKVVEYLENVSNDDKLVLIDLLGEMGNPLAIESLIINLKNNDSKIRWSAKESLGKIASTNLKEVIKYLEYEDDDIRYVIVFILTEIDDERVINPLLISLYDSDPDIRFKAFEFLSKTEDERILSYVNDLVNDENIGLRISAIKYLAKKGNKNSLECLYETLSDDDYKVRNEAKNAIKSINESLGVKDYKSKVNSTKKIKQNIKTLKKNESHVKSKNPMKLLSDLRSS